ncbi:MAG: MlaD family protein [Solirubrobacteraceae bacterium]
MRARQRGHGLSPVAAGALLILAIVVGTYFGFSKHIPFTHGFRVKGVFSSAVSIRKNSPVRIAGVNVGKVKGISRYQSTDASVVTMELQDSALPLHRDTTMKIRPRIFLEGNFFVDLRPGTPSSPRLHDGDTIGLTQTAAPVQLDEVLTSLQSDARTDLQDLLSNYGAALTRQPTARDDASQDPEVRGKSAAQAFNRLYDYAPGAERGASIVNQALLGTGSHDLSKLIASFGKVAGALDRNEQALKDLITNFSVTTGAFAAQQANLRASIRLLAPTLSTANRTLGALNAAFPPTRAFAREILPGVRETPATIEASFPWIDQTRRLLAPSELGGLARALRPTSADLARLTDRTIALLPQVDLVDKCVTKVVLPTGDVVIDDGPNNSNPNIHTGSANYKEFWYGLVGLASEGQNFDGNGMYVRFQPGGGPFTLSTGASSLSGQQLFGNAAVQPLGVKPRYPGRRPPYNPNFPCYRNKLPELNGPAAAIGPPPTLRTRSAAGIGSDPRLRAAAGLLRQGQRQAGALSSSLGAPAAGNASPPAGGASPARPGGGGAATSLTQQLLARLNPFGSRAGSAP